MKKIIIGLFTLFSLTFSKERFKSEYPKIGTLRNFKNSNDNPVQLESFLTSPERDKYGVRRYQGIPLYQSLDKKPRMNYLKLGSSSEIAGFAPYATRFSGGGYIHGIPVELPRTEIIEYSPTLGSTPKSRMCVRNASSHAKYVYEWAKPLNTLVIVIE